VPVLCNFVASGTATGASMSSVRIPLPGQRLPPAIRLTASRLNHISISTLDRASSLEASSGGWAVPNVDRMQIPIYALGFLALCLLTGVAILIAVCLRQP